MWLGYYAEQTPGVQVLDNATTILGLKSEPQPDGLLRILPECDGRTQNKKGFIHGPPELVVEVAKATRYVDLGPKLADYERAGVLEYVVHAIDPDEIFWYGQETMRALVQRPIGGDGLYRSTVFPGLWLDPRALISGDTRRQRAGARPSAPRRARNALSSSLRLCGVRSSLWKPDSHGSRANGCDSRSRGSTARYHFSRNEPVFLIEIWHGGEVFIGLYPRGPPQCRWLA